MSDDEVVPGMAEAIEARIIELRLTPSDLLRRSGLTAPGWAPIRAGKRKRYQAKLKYGVADALEWEADAVDRLLRGEPPVPIQATTPEGFDTRLRMLEVGQAQLKEAVELLLARLPGDQPAAPQSGGAARPGTPT